MASLQCHIGQAAVGLDSHRVDEEIAIVGTATVARSGIERIVGLIRAREAIIPVPLGQLSDRATLRDLADTVELAGREKTLLFLGSCGKPLF